MNRIEGHSRSARIEELMTQDEKHAFTLLSYFAILTIYLNQTFANLLPIGAIAALAYLLINGAFLGNTIFEEERFALKLLLGNFLLLVFLGLVSWVVIVIASDLGAASSAIVLLIVATLASLLNKLRAKFRR